METVKAGEHPLMSNRALKAMYAGMVRGRLLLGTGGRAAARAARRDLACVVSPVAGLKETDAVFGCRTDAVIATVRSGGKVTTPKDSVIEGGVARLYAALGAARVMAGTEGVVVAFFERHETGKAEWFKALGLLAELPVMLVVLPRWKGVDGDLDLCRESRAVGVPGIAADAEDAVALWRVAQESLGRARAGGGAALIEGVRFALRGGAPDEGADAVAAMGEVLLRRKVASTVWMRRVAATFSEALAANTPGGE